MQWTYVSLCGIQIDKIVCLILAQLPLLEHSAPHGSPRPRAEGVFIRDSSLPLNEELLVLVKECHVYLLLMIVVSSIDFCWLSYCKDSFLIFNIQFSQYLGVNFSLVELWVVFTLPISCSWVLLTNTMMSLQEWICFPSLRGLVISPSPSLRECVAINLASK
jgi:hypothetical protein